MIATNSKAQVTLGVKTGLNFSNMSLTGVTGMTESSRTGFHIGAILDFNISSSFSLESGLLLSSKGAAFDQPSQWTYNNSPVTLTQTRTASPLYLEIPINAIYKIDFKPITLNLFAGPYFGFGVSGSMDYEYSATGLTAANVTLQGLLDAINAQNPKEQLKNQSLGIKYGSKDGDDMKSFDMGITFGAGVEFYNAIFRLQYSLGFSNVWSVPANGEVLKNNVISVSVGYFFRKK